ncbi:MAG: activator of HSP90 ATPase [Cyclobacteriaceae bacterium]|jgi:activator of HSP90 ATPase
MKDHIELKETFSVKADVIYKAWLDSEEHTLMTGGGALCSDKENGEFTAWDGYISGHNKSLIENKRIVQSWRTTEFEETDNDSELIIELVETDEGCELTLIHSAISRGKSNYEQGWIDHYFIPMKAYFNDK